MLSVIRQLDVLVYPPAINIMLLLVAILVWRQRKLALSLVSVALATLLLFSLPAVSQALLFSLEDYPAIPPGELKSKNAQAIVLLGGGAIPNAAEYGYAQLGKESYARLRYAAFIHQRTGLPILPSGGHHIAGTPNTADLMQQTLGKTYGISAVWPENESKTTRENAIFSAKILKTKNIRRVFLVTNGWHMKRSVQLFEEQGIDVIPAPTGMSLTSPLRWRDFLPNGGALKDTRIALHEYLGRLLYFL